MWDPESYIIEIQSCAVNVHQDMARDWFRFWRTLCEFYLGWVVEPVDYEGAHSEDREIRRQTRAELCSDR